ncbi:MAG: hypothetical protein FD167_2948 [bacterium]|nr:MAG: hypothetical protein FD167_2948 [bacterium]TSC90018.1 MAG: hypothetical protein G01um10145_449 [Microgenomates group bacterium Gr01-1014_5]
MSKYLFITVVVVLIGILFLNRNLNNQFSNNDYQNSQETVKIVTPPPMTPERKIELNKLNCLMVQDEEDMDCSDFPDKDTAKGFYKAEIDCFGYDKFGLDRDSDGIACESLPERSD